MDGAPDAAASPGGPPRPALPVPADRHLELDASRRALVFFLALLVAVWMGSRAASAVAMGFPLTAATLVAFGILYVALLGSIALAPGPIAEWLAARTAVRLGAPGHLVAFLLLATTVFVVFVVGSGLPFALEAEGQLRGAPLEEPATTETEVLVSLGFNLLILGVPVLLWLLIVNDLRGVALARALGFRTEGLVGATALGGAIALAAILVLALVALAAQGIGITIPPNERALGIGQALSLEGALAVAALASLSEEVFFRGFLQPRIGLVAQAVLFSVAHLSYFNALQLVATLVLGFAFGLAYRWTGSLAAPIAAHFAFNAIMLVAAQAVPAA